MTEKRIERGRIEAPQESTVPPSIVGSCGMMEPNSLRK